MSGHAAFLQGTGWDGASRTPMTSDAGDRRYWRLTRGDGATAVLMEAPVAVSEAARRQFTAFRRIGAWLRAQGLSAPCEVKADAGQGLMLLEDLGQTSLSHLLDQGAPDAREAYLAAVDCLADVAGAADPPELPQPIAGGVAEMLTPLSDAIGGIADLQAGIEAALDAIPSPPVLSLRDIHGDNLMWLPARRGPARIGLLDFQDAVLLPDGYDLASLFDDPRREVPAEWRAAGLTRYAAARGQDPDDLARRVALLSVLRNLRILAIFHRLSAEAGRARYGAHIPRTRHLIDRAAAHPGLHRLAPSVAEVLRRTTGWGDVAA